MEAYGGRIVETTTSHNNCRLIVKDFDATSTNDFIGEFTVPVSSIRSGYSHIRLNTGFEHSPDDAASLFVRVALEDE